MAAPDSFAARLAGSTPEEVAQMAEMLLAHPLLGVALEEMDQDAANTWRNADTAAMREEMWHRQKAIRDLKARLQSRLDDVKMANKSAKMRGGR